MGCEGCKGKQINDFADIPFDQELEMLHNSEVRCKCGCNFWTGMHDNKCPVCGAGIENKLLCDTCEFPDCMNCDPDSDILIKLQERNKELEKKIEKIKEVIVETIQELNNEKSGYQASDHAKNIYENEIWFIDQKINILDDILGEFYKERTEG